MRGMLALVCLATVLAACSRSGEQQGGRAPPPVPVVVATVVQKAVPVELRVIGNVMPSNTVTVRARVGGVLAGVHFKEGQDVEEGQRLFTLDRGPLEAELRQAQANLAKDPPLGRRRVSAGCRGSGR
jgi:membrane fusion protein, multidrug efflux system